MRRRGGAAAVLIVAAVALAVVVRVPAWRAVYGHLPRRAQAAPYVLQGLVRGHSTPVPLPTAAGSSGLAAPAPPPRALSGPSPPDPSPSPWPETPAPPLPGEVTLAAPAQQYQTWNNCGPATLGMALGVLGRPVGQAEAAKILKPDPDDKNVSPGELAAFVRGTGLDAAVRVGGTVDELRGLLAAGVPVVAETWFIPEPGDEMGHYLLVRGYSDSGGGFLTNDSYLGPDRHVTYSDFDRLWRVFNRTYVAVFSPVAKPRVEAVLGPLDDGGAMYGRAVEVALGEIEAAPDAYGWFNLGSSLMGLGEARAAADAYDRARALGLPWRMLWYQFGPFEAYAAVGRWDDVESLASANLHNAPNLEESLYWLGRSRQARGDVAGARRAYRRALGFNPLYGAPAEGLDGLGSD